MSIRKFVGVTKVAAGFGAALALALTAQTAVARDADSVVRAAPATQLTQATLSSECTAAITALKTALHNDRQEDVQERAEAKANPALANDPAEDALEHAAFKPMFDAVRRACFPAIAGAPTKPAPTTVSAACTSALQAWKAAVKAIWAQGTRPTAAQTGQLQALGQAAKTACGWRAWWTTEWHGVPR